MLSGHVTPLLRHSDWSITLLPVRLQAHAAATQDLMQIKLLAFNHSELRVELRPRPCSTLSTNQLEPLRLLVSWSSEDRFRLQVTQVSNRPETAGKLTCLSTKHSFLLQVEEGPVGVLEGSVSGRWAELSPALLRILQGFMGQAELLSEIQNLRTR